MAGKGKKKRNSKDSSGSNGAAAGETTKKKGKKKASSKGKSFQCDILNDAAMENAYFCCHNVQVNNL